MGLISNSVRWGLYVALVPAGHTAGEPPETPRGKEVWGPTPPTPHGNHSILNIHFLCLPFNFIILGEKDGREKEKEQWNKGQEGQERRIRKQERGGGCRGLVRINRALRKHLKAVSLDK